MNKVKNYKNIAYQCWENMKQRCLNPNNTNYPTYGGRGITVCEEFKTFSLFLAHIGERPSTNHSIDRIDNNKGYILGNVRWSNHITQVRNRDYYKNYKIYRYRKDRRSWYATYGKRDSRISKSFGTEAEARAWLDGLADIID